MKRMIKLFEDIFGHKFWPNVIFAVSRWSYADHAVEARKLRGDTEKEWIAERNEQFKKLSKKLNREYGDIGAVFIDAHYDPTDLMEADNFKKEMAKLWEFASNAPKFELKDIEAALDEIQTLIEEKRTLKEELADAKRRPPGALNENQLCLGLLGCINVPSFGGISTGLLLLGVVLGLICGCQGSKLCDWLLCCCPKRCWNCCPDGAKPAALRAPEDQDQVIKITIGDGDDSEEEKRDLKGDSLEG